MPAEAYALVATFAAVSVLAGLIATAVIGQVVGRPRGWRWAILPAAAAFVALYGIGHRLGLVAGPQVELWGFQVSIVLDVGVAFAAAFAMALVQAGVVRVRPSSA